MLAPLRDYPRPKDPKSSPLFCATKGHYFTRMSVNIDPDYPRDHIEGHKCRAPARFLYNDRCGIGRLLESLRRFYGAPRLAQNQLIVLGPGIEGLPDDHPHKPRCLLQLSQLFQMVGNQAERTRLLVHTLKLERERENDSRVAQLSSAIFDSRLQLGLPGEGIRLKKGL
jgi:hypothetical protein